VAGTCECGNKPSGYIKRGEFLFIIIIIIIIITYLLTYLLRLRLHWYSYLYQLLVQVTNLAFNFPRQVGQ